MQNSVLSYELFILYLGLDLRQVMNGKFVVLYSFPSRKEVYEKNQSIDRDKLLSHIRIEQKYCVDECGKNCV